MRAQSFIAVAIVLQATGTVITTIFTKSLETTHSSLHSTTAAGKSTEIDMWIIYLWVSSSYLAWTSTPANKGLKYFGFTFVDNGALLHTYRITGYSQHNSSVRTRFGFYSGESANPCYSPATRNFSRCGLWHWSHSRATSLRFGMLTASIEPRIAEVFTFDP